MKYDYFITISKKMQEESKFCMPKPQNAQNRFSHFVYFHDSRYGSHFPSRVHVANQRKFLLDLHRIRRSTPRGASSPHLVMLTIYNLFLQHFLVRHKMKSSLTHFRFYVILFYDMFYFILIQKQSRIFSLCRKESL